MTQFSDQIDKQNLINIARAKYESTQLNKLPSNVIKLTSNGKIYPETHPLRGGTIEMRFMTAYDEDILTNASYIREGILFDKLLEAVITSDILVSDIAAVDRDGLIINARILAYGSEYPVIVTDPKTKKELSRTVDLSKIQSTDFNLTSDENGEFSYEVNPALNLKFSYRKYDLSEDLKISEFLKNIITQVGDSRNPADIEHYIRYDFLARDAKQFRKYVSDNKPSLDLTYEFEGEDGSTFKTGFPLGTDLFWF